MYFLVGIRVNLKRFFYHIVVRTKREGLEVFVNRRGEDCEEMMHETETVVICWKHVLKFVNVYKAQI